MSPKTNRLASLLGTLTNAAPVDFDPETPDADQPGPSSLANGNASSSGSNDDQDEEEDAEESDEEYTNPRAHYADVGTSEMRKKAALSESDKINDPRYQGVKSSRAELYADEDEEEDDDGADDSEDGEQRSEEDDEEGEGASRRKQVQFADENESDSEASSSSETDQVAASTSNSIAAQIAQSVSQAKALKARRLEDAEKGRQVRNQIKTFERALETRIKAQSVLREVNRLPDPEVYTSAISITTAEPVITVLEQLLELSETLFSLRTRLNTLSRSADEGEGTIETPATRKRKRDFDVTVPEDEEEAKQTWAEIVKHDQIDATLNDVATFSSVADVQRRAVLDKWSLKVTSAAAAASNGNKFTQLRAVNQPPSAQIDAALAGDGLSRLIARTRVLRSADSPASAKLGQAYTPIEEEVKDSEVFDDSDFYSALLKELIECRSGVGITNGDGVGATAAMTLSGLNGGKKKKATVDTRASKGRKLRYEVNEKIVNFMPPIPERVKWGQEQIERLFRQLASSSMGVAREANGEDEAEVDKDKEAEEADLAGLRVFG
ncbi:Protein BFR2 [Ustilago sp. UG-2017a]|nr:Protein BFR2 [Ustilago sp. UG-2017a]